ncbi:hypothetical protein N7492_009081 [Penicillium capsulatum]|uniref:Thioredoxin n=1 Tax=Penicillium capsulatum TaxID=69766 RepID=A0A9W9HQZ3_9EURO|nr:hypothetical protein N7492_009081 [Penicillium capsulatum]KAJ6106480.1 hypothetical protein N7512_009997 [Penicillium capsulatum]
MGVAELKGKPAFVEAISSGDVIIIDFWATWCGPCQAISPVFEALAEQTVGPKFYKVDVDAEEDIAQEVGIRAMPTFMVFKDWEKVGEVAGADPQKLTALVDQFKA